MAKASNRVKRTRGKPLEAGQDDRRQVGRPKGSVNRYTAALKDAILLSLNSSGRLLLLAGDRTASRRPRQVTR